MNDSAGARGDVAEVTQRRRKMIDLDVGVRPRAGADALQEVGVMRGEVGAGGGLDVLDELVPLAVDLPALGGG